MTATDDERRETRLELARVVWAVLLIDAAALGIGLLADQYIPGARWVGVVIAAWVTAAFVLLVGGNLVIVWVLRRLRGVDV